MKLQNTISWEGSLGNIFSHFKISIAVLKHQKEHGKERVYLLTLPHCCPSWKEVRAETSWQEVKQKPGRNITVRLVSCVLLGLLTSTSG